MFTERDYVCVCHGCGRFHIVRSMFISVPMSMSFPTGDEKGTQWCVPALGCLSCQLTPRDANGDNPISLAWKHGSTPAALMVAVNAFNTEWRAKLEAQKAVR